MEQNIYLKLAQFKTKEITLSRDIEGFNYKYANLLQIQDKIGPILEELKLIITHRVENQKVITRITNLEGNDFIESGIDIGEVKTENTKDLFDKQGNKIGVSIESNSLDPQGVGSIITYYRRYNILALLDLETEDDDGKKGSAKGKSNEFQKENKKDLPKHTCTKCGAVVGAEVFSGKFGLCFKCSECGNYSKPNPFYENGENLAKVDNWDTGINSPNKILNK